MRWDGDRGGRPPAVERARVQDVEARVLKLWGYGKTYREIGGDLGLSKGTVTGIVDRSSGPAAEKAKSDHRLNIAARETTRKMRARKDPERQARILEIWRLGQSATQIGMALGVTRNVVIGIVARAKLPPRGKQAALTAARPKLNLTPKRPPETPVCKPKPAAAPVSKPKRQFLKPPTNFRQPPQLALVASTPLPVAPAEPPFDPYSHLRSDRNYHDALAAMSRPARSKEGNCDGARTQET